MQGHWNVLLDGRTIKTPKKAVLTVPSHMLAIGIAAEFQAQAADAVCSHAAHLGNLLSAIVPAISMHYGRMAHPLSLQRSLESIVKNSASAPIKHGRYVTMRLCLQVRPITQPLYRLQWQAQDAAFKRGDLIDRLLSHVDTDPVCLRQPPGPSQRKVRVVSMLSIFAPFKKL
jgi:ATP12 chaperone protein